MRSSGLPSARGLNGITRVIRMRARSVTIKRPQRTTNELDDTEETIDEHTETMWLSESMESISDEIGGQRINGSLGGLVVASDTLDIQIDDRVTYGGVEYEVETVVGHPEDDSPDGTASPSTDFFIVSFTRRQT